MPLYFAVARVGLHLVLNAAPVQRGVQYEAAQIQGLFACSGQNHVAALLFQLQKAAWAVAVRHIPVGGNHQIVFHRRFVEIVQLRQMQLVGRAFGVQAGLRIP